MLWRLIKNEMTSILGDSYFFQDNSNLSKKEKITQEVMDVQRVFESLKLQLIPVTQLNLHDKLWIDRNGFIEVNEASTTQFLSRWYYGQNREKTYAKLHELFTDYSKLIFILMQMNRYAPNTIVFMNNLVYSFNEQLITGLEILKQTYEYNMNSYQLSSIFKSSEHSLITEKLIVLLTSFLKKIIKINSILYKKRICVLE